MKPARTHPGAGVGRIGVAFGVASVAGYALLTLVGRTLTPAEFGVFVVFWGLLFGLGGSLSTLEQEIARRTAAQDTEPPAGTVTCAAAALAVLIGSATLLPPIADRLYGASNWVLGLAVLLALFGFAIQFAVKGVAMGSGRSGVYASVVVAEAGVRLTAASVVAVSVGLDLVSAAFAVALGAFAWLLWIPRARAVLRTTERDLRQWRDAIRRAVALLAGAGLTTVLVTGYPTLVAALTGEAPGAAGGAAFAALTISRVPLLLIAPLQAVAVPAVVRWQSEPFAGGRSQTRRFLVSGTLGTAVLAVVAGGVGWWLGPSIVKLVYGSSYEVERDIAALLAVSALLLAWGLLLSAALIALSAVRRMIVMWATATGATVLWLALSSADVASTTAVGALVGPAAAIACALPLLWPLTAAGAHPAGTAAGTVTPSPEPNA